MPTDIVKIISSSANVHIIFIINKKTLSFLFVDCEFLNSSTVIQTNEKLRRTALSYHTSVQTLTLHADFVYEFDNLSTDWDCLGDLQEGYVLSYI